jgi:hypothetical protein
MSDFGGYSSKSDVVSIVMEIPNQKSDAGKFGENVDSILIDDLRVLLIETKHNAFQEQRKLEREKRKLQEKVQTQEATITAQQGDIKQLRLEQQEIV